MHVPCSSFVFKWPNTEISLRLSCFWPSVVPPKHLFALSQDYPSSWPWGKVSADDKAPIVGSFRGRGRGRGRGGKKSSSSTMDGKDTCVGQTETTEQKQNSKDSSQQRVPYLLTNLVRTGNQMSAASTWNLLQKSVRACIVSKLQLLPLSDYSSPEAQSFLAINTATMEMLGKLPEIVIGKNGLKKPSALRDTTTELLSCLWTFEN